MWVTVVSRDKTSTYVVRWRPLLVTKAYFTLAYVVLWRPLLDTKAYSTPVI